jgi:predicted transcriptional regulator
MYGYIMTRTQIYLSDAEAKVLDRAARASGRTRSSLIREAIDRHFLGSAGQADLVRTLEQTAGSWRGRRPTGAEQVEQMRSGRLARQQEAQASEGTDKE